MENQTTTIKDVKNFLTNTSHKKLITSGLSAGIVQYLPESVVTPRVEYACGETYLAATYAGVEVFVNPYQSYNDMIFYNEAGEAVFTVYDPEGILL